MKSVLIIAAHPDDEVIGCGGTIAKLAEAGVDVYTLVLQGAYLFFIPLDPEGLKDYYRQKNLLRTEVLADHMG